MRAIGLKGLSLVASVFLLAACGGNETATNTGGGYTTATPPAPVATTSGPIGGSQEDLVVNVGDRVFFAFDSSVIDGEARATLDRQAAWLGQYPTNTLTLEGHADERGTREYNLALGERRATAVKQYLVAAGVDPSRLTTISYGKERPVCVASDDNCYAQNRRGVSVLN